MFGSYRFALAVMVVAAHLVKPLAAQAGNYAVFSFFLLSGYLMTRISNETYRDGLAGFLRFCENRALRIFPCYWTCLAFALLVVLIGGPGVAELKPQLVLPEGREIFANLFIFGILEGEGVKADARLLPLAWSLNIELVYYLAIAALLGRHKGITVIWFAASLALAVCYVTIDAGMGPRYTSFIGPSIAFASGAMAYHYGQLFRVRAALVVPICGLAMFFLAFVVHLVAPGSTLSAFKTGLYVLLPFAAAMTLVLARLPRKRWDEYLGDLSYPIFLVHWPAAALLKVTLFATADMLTLFVATLALSSLVGAAVVALVEEPLKPIRSRLRTARAFA